MHSLGGGGVGTTDFGPSALLGVSLADLFRLEAQAKKKNDTVSGSGPGWGKAKSVILIYLQGGPSHLDLWDPKENVPTNVASEFKPISTKIPGVNFTAPVFDTMPETDSVSELMAEITVEIAIVIANCL